MTVADTALRPLALETLGKLPRPTRLALEMLNRLEGGALAVELPDNRHLRLGHGPLVAHLRVRDHAVFDEALARGDIGFAESYMDGDWDTEDLTGLLTLLSSNRARLQDAIYGRVLRLIRHRLTHLLRANTRTGSRRNIEAHYDLGNDFYSLWLDPGMTYSAALFAYPDESLAAAQLRKYRRILQQLAPRPGQIILEVGCGWGGFAEVAATEFDCRVLGITLSPSQLAFALERAIRGGFSDRVQFELCDYRDVKGRYDHVVSIEMIEAVGERFWPTYFGQLSALLKPGGRCVVQSITIADHLFARYRRGTDFIQRHIFPGGMLPCPQSVRRQAARAGLEIVDDFGFGPDYGLTLARWREAFDARAAEIADLGFPQRFLRMWRFYLAYCEAGFRAGDIDVRHYTFARAAGR
ncbi:class I SAM-dependent methyltransferase [Azoarcus sp. L1K30]|uniref:SAM-dependent methyltransferase n=1 Tax=Azoarcus sp. L1K30 TaxID=2820277 RepID=UPI001B8255B3|nr:cyclopropane-fatty-acyl-phospholipid synthase family protein [Azoarcus sp. L1K30]MBR0567853.1 class I SAM-dependent methyltransferase [Azoarcus sp. L1K30]